MSTSSTHEKGPVSGLKNDLINQMGEPYTRVDVKELCCKLGSLAGMSNNAIKEMAETISDSDIQHVKDDFKRRTERSNDDAGRTSEMLMSDMILSKIPQGNSDDLSSQMIGFTQPINENLNTTGPYFLAASFHPKNPLDKSEIGEIFRHKFNGSLEAPNLGLGQTLDGIKQEVSVRVNDIFTSYERLRKIVGKYTLQIQQRWMKRTGEKRKALLLRAWPDMPPRHHPDFYAFKRRLNDEKYRYAYLMPHVNLEDLSKPRNLLLLFDSRTKLGPDAFALSDANTLGLAVSARCLTILSRPGYTMFLTGRPSRETYGIIVSWKEDTDSTKEMYMGLGFTLGRGMIVLEIQSKLLSFLIRCAEILFESNPDLLTTSLDDHTGPSGGAQTSTTPDLLEWHSTIEINTEAPYRVPRRFAFKYPRRLALAKLDEAEDEIWALRETPAYFQQTLQCMFQMKYKGAQKASQDLKQTLHPKTKGRMWQIACQDLVGDAYKSLITWNLLLTDLTCLEKMYSDLSIQDSAEKPLSDDYKRTVVGFAIVEILLKTFPSNDLRVKLASDPPLQEYYDTVLSKEGSLAFGLRNMTEIPPILSLINDLLDEKQAYTLGTSKIIDGVERLMQSDASQHALITGPVAQELSEIAAFAEIETHMHRHQPKITLPVYRDTSAKLAERRIEKITTIREALEGAKIAQYAEKINLIDFSSYGKPTKDATSKMRFMEAGLDHFWWRVDEYLEKQGGTTLRGLIKKSTSARKLQRTPRWQAPAYSKPAGPSAVFQISKVNTDTKLKARREAGLPKITALPEPEKQADTVPHIQTFKLASRAYKVMSILFPNAIQERTSSKVTWKEFVHAFYKLDFSIRSLHGSAWYFEPTWQSDSPILFNEPYPVDEIPFVTLQLYANRLGWKYGWTSETFLPA